MIYKLYQNKSLSLWYMIYPAFIIGFVTVYLLSVGVIPLYYLLVTFVMWILSCGLGIAVGYHRVFSHRTHVLPAWKENVIMSFAVFSGQGSSIFWTALHRGYHHQYTDTDRDIHSPISKGIWTSFIGWYSLITEKNSPVKLKYAIDLLKKRNHRWFSKHHLKILWWTPLLVAIFDWKLALTGFWLVTMIGVLQDNGVNVLGHIKAFIGYRNFNTKDNSQNNIILGYLGWGQGWHNNHHHNPKSFDFGKGVSGKWWEWDPCNIFLPFLK